jgi:hypothetical protein
MNLWYHALMSHFQQGKSSPLWKGIQGRLGYVNLMNPCSEMVTTIDNPESSWSLTFPLTMAFDVSNLSILVVNVRA